MKRLPRLNTLAKICSIGFAAILIFRANSTAAQVHVLGPEQLKIGKEQAILNRPQQVEVVDVLGSVYIKQDASGQHFSGGLYFNQLNHVHLGINYTTSIMKPQWDNSYWLGSQNNQFWRVYAQQLYVNRTFYTSDERLKSNFKPLQNSLSKVMSLSPYTYDFIGRVNETTPKEAAERMKIDGKNQVGFKAQDVKINFPHLVNYDEEADLYSIDYNGFVPEMVRAIQEQQDIIDALKAEIETFKGSEINLQNSNTVQTTSELFDIKPIEPKKPVVVNYQTESQGDYQIRVYNLAGKQVYKTEALNPDINSIELPRKKLGAGSYYVTLFKNGEEVNTKKVIVLD